MDATFFRALCQELSERIRGMRIEKVFAPAPHLWTIGLGRAGYLVLHTARPLPFMLLTTHKPENPSRPSGQAMWLRTRVQERRIIDLLVDWPRRRLALELSPGEGRWLLLGLEEEPTVIDALPEAFGADPLWPDLATILTQQRIWELCPQITPPLRRMLTSLDAIAATACLEQLRLGEMQTFYVVQDHRGQVQARLWPENDATQFFSSALTAAEQAYGPAVAQTVHHRAEDSARARVRKRLQRALIRLEANRGALEAMIQGGSEGRWLCASLHTLDKQARCSSVQVHNDLGELVKLTLRPDWTILENMQYRFQRASKGQRGLPLVAERREALRRELEALESGGQERVCPDPTQVADLAHFGTANTTKTEPALVLSTRFKRIKVSAFRSSDGFVLLRGRSAEANHQLVRAAKPFDYWLHAQDGPGAHVLIVREHPMQDVPETTILEGACLAALSSHMRLADRGDVLLCLARDVRAAKGASAGQVNVSAVLRIVRPHIDPAVEQRLRVEPR